MTIKKLAKFYNKNKEYIFMNNKRPFSMEGSWNDDDGDKMMMMGDKMNNDDDGDEAKEDEMMVMEMK